MVVSRSRAAGTSMVAGLQSSVKFVLMDDVVCSRVAHEKETDVVWRRCIIAWAGRSGGRSRTSDGQSGARAARARGSTAT